MVKGLRLLVVRLGDRKGGEFMMNDKQRNALQGQIVEAVEQRSPWELRQTR